VSPVPLPAAQVVRHGFVIAAVVLNGVGARTVSDNRAVRGPVRLTRFHGFLMLAIGLCWTIFGVAVFLSGW
jgi:hypothetical protein